MIATMTVMLPLILALVHLVLSCDNWPTVQTPSDKFQGFVDRSTDGYLYHAFKGIPYAIPPVGPLRFKPPVPIDHCTEAVHGTKDGNMCPQIHIMTKKYVGDEDCLYLNIYVSKIYNSSSELLPVFFFLHGGAFIYESGNFVDFGPQKLMNHPIVVVTINYRLGALGFLSTNDSSSYGNYGLWDQQLALQWVQQNIETFGGDKDRVTVVGQSAGSASVLYHLMSDHSKGLLSRAISMSGAPINYWAFQNNPAEVAVAYATKLGCNNLTSNKIVDCLRNKTAFELVANTNPFFPLQFLPTIDAGGLGFIREHPMQSLKSGRIANKVPLMMGRNLNEGFLIYLILQFGFNPNVSGSEYFENIFSNQLSTISNVNLNMTSAINAIKDNYYKNAGKNIDDPDVFRDVLQNIAGDVSFHADIAYTIEQLNKAGLSVYPYIYDHIGEICYGSIFYGKCGLYCSHGDELFMIWQHWYNYMLNEKDVKVSEVLVKLIVDFISQSEKIVVNNDGDVWPIFTEQHPQYVSINSNPTIKNGTLSNMTKFWTETIYLQFS